MTWAVILAAGSSTRFGGSKLTELIDGVPVWRRSLEAFRRSDIAGILVAASPDLLPVIEGADILIEGGSMRQESSRLALQALPRECTHVLIHDAARPWVTPALIDRVFAATLKDGAAFPGLPATDTIKRVTDDGVETLTRSELFTVQTPQGARLDWLLAAHSSAQEALTDDMALLEFMGHRPILVAGDRDNIKITYRSDMETRPLEFRTGMGYDIHRFSDDPNRPMWLGGIEFDSRPGLDGHSDADALIHAIVDALLGAAGMGDIGEHYPNTDPRWKDCPSVRFLEETGVRVRAAGWTIRHIDAVVLAERPRLLPRRGEMQAVMAAALRLDPSQISLKATTNEKLGAIGRSEGIAASAVANLSRPL